MKTTLEQCKHIRVFWMLSKINKSKYRSFHRDIHRVFPHLSFERYELEFMMVYLDGYAGLDMQEFVDGIPEEHILRVYSQVSELWDEIGDIVWPKITEKRYEKMQYLIHASPVFSELNAIDASEPHKKEIIKYIKSHAIYDNFPSVSFNSKNLIGLLELANFTDGVNLTWRSGCIHTSHSLYLDHHRPEYVFDSLLDDFPEDLEEIDEHFENTKQLKADWLAKYDGCSWQLDSLEDLLEFAEPL